MKSPLFLGIDVGTSKIKVCLFDADGRMIREGLETTRVNKSDKGHVELDPEKMYNMIISLIRDTTLGKEKNVVSISFSVSSPTVIFVDKDINPVLPAILYLDRRTDDIVNGIVEKVEGVKNFFKKTGNNPSPSTCAAALVQWVKLNEPRAWERVDKFIFLNTYLAAKFTGNIYAEPTVASYSGLVDVRKPLNWDLELMEILGVENRLLPDIVSSFKSCGTLTAEVAKQTGLSQDVKVVLGSADTAASSFGLGINKQGDVFESLGTSGVFTVCLDKPSFDKAFMNRFHVIPGLWLSHGAMSTTGAAIKWLIKDVFSDCNGINEIESKGLESPCGANGVVFLPYLSGERSPIFDAKACGVFFGLNLNTQKSDMVRAVYESSAYGMYQLYSIAREKWGITPEAIKCVGGASNSKLALQIRADLFGIPFRAVRAINSSAYGAAMLGAVGSGYHTLETVPYSNTLINNFSTNEKNKRIYRENFEIYKSLYPKLKDLMHQM